MTGKKMPGYGLKPRSSNRLLAILGIGIALSLAGDQTLYTVLADPQIVSQAGISLAMVGIVLGVNRLTRIFFNTPAGFLYDRSKRRRLMIISISIGALSTAFYALASDEGLLLFGRVLWGIAWSGIWIGANTMALDVSGDQDRGGMSGRLQMWFFLGVAASSLIGGFFTDVLGYRGAMWFSAALTTIGVIFWIFTLPETQANLALSEEIPTKQTSDSPFPWIVTLKAAVPLFALRFVFAGVLAASTILWLGQFLDGGLSLAGITIPLATITGGFVAMRVVLSMFTAPVAGLLSDRLGVRWTILAFTAFIGSIGLWIMGLAMPLLAVGGAILATISAGSIQGLVPAIIGDETNHRQKSRALGVVFTIGDLGSALGPVIGLMLIPVLGIGEVIQLCALLFGTVALLALWIAIQEKRGTKARYPEITV
jgi:MFS family permease